MEMIWPIVRESYETLRHLEFDLELQGDAEIPHLEALAAVNRVE